jgi:hypothetical protein
VMRMSTAWKITTRRGIAYVEGWDTVQRVREAAGLGLREVKRGASVEDYLLGHMAVYLDRRGKPFAWLVPFDLKCWEAVNAALC